MSVHPGNKEMGEQKEDSPGLHHPGGAIGPDDSIWGHENGHTGA